MLLDNEETTTKDFIKQFLQKKPLVVALPQPKIISIAADLPQIFGQPKKPADFELKPIYARLLRALHQNGFEQVSARDWRYAPYVFWYGDEFLASDHSFLGAYFTWLGGNMLPSNWRRLIFSYLRYYHYHRDFPASYALIAKVISAALTYKNLEMRLAKWIDGHHKLALFRDDFNVTKACNVYVNTFNGDWSRFIKDTGLDGELSKKGYVEVVGDALLMQLSKTSDLKLIAPIENYFFEQNTLRFKNKHIQLIEALLSPWVKNPSLQAEAEKDAIYNLLLKHFHDPRLSFNKEHWRLVSEPALRVMYRWLTEASIDQFFEIIDRMALEHQWKYRKKFWQAYFDKGYIDQAWVAFSANPRRVAQSAFGKYFSAGILDGCLEDQSVLIIQIKDLIIAEMSHNGKCRAWKVDDINCPRMNDDYSYKKGTKNTLRNPSMHIVPFSKDDGISHTGSENYKWQNRLSEFIYNETGIRVSQRDYRI